MIKHSGGVQIQHQNIVRCYYDEYINSVARYYDIFKKMDLKLKPFQLAVVSIKLSPAEFTAQLE